MAITDLDNRDSLHPRDIAGRIIDAIRDEETDRRLRARMRRWLFDGDDETRKQEALLERCHRLTPCDEPLSGDGLARYERLAGRLGFTSAPLCREVVRPRSHTWHNVAAALILPIVATVCFILAGEHSPSGIEFRIASGDHPREAFLPDGSQVELGPGSSVAYRESATGRYVEQSGEVSFNVAHDAARPFTVHAGDISVEALGTEFSLRACAGDPVSTVSTFSGSVAVDAGGDRCMVPEGGRLEFDRVTGSRDIRSIPPRAMTERGHAPDMMFSRATFGEVLEALSLRYDVVIEYDRSALADYGDLMIDLEGESLESSLALLAAVSDGRLRYAVDGRRVGIIWREYSD